MRQDFAGKLAKKQKGKSLDHRGRLSKHRLRSMLFWSRVFHAGVGLFELASALELDSRDERMRGIAHFTLEVPVLVEIVVACRVIAVIADIAIKDRLGARRDKPHVGKPVGQYAS